MLKKWLILLLLTATCFAGHVKPGRGAQINISHPLARGLVGHWPMNEGTGTMVWDYSRNGNTGTLVGDTAWVAGKLGPALSFDGTGDYVDCGQSSQIGGGGGLSVSLWMKIPTNTIAATQFVLAKRGGSDADRTFAFYVNSSENVYFTVYTAVPDDALCWYKDAFLNVADVWKHIVGVYDGTSINIYVNGVVGAEVALSGVTNSNSTAFVMGAENDSAQNAWPGELENVMIYNRALAVSEINWLYRKQFAMYGPGGGWRDTTSGAPTITPKTQTIIIAGIEGGLILVAILCCIILLNQYQLSRWLYCIVILFLVGTSYGAICTPVEECGTGISSWEEGCIPWLSGRVVFDMISMGLPNQYLRVNPGWDDRGYYFDTITTDDVGEGANKYCTLTTMKSLCHGDFHNLGGNDRGFPNPYEWTESQLELSLSGVDDVLTDIDDSIAFPGDFTFETGDKFIVDAEDNIELNSDGDIYIDPTTDCYIQGDLDVDGAINMSGTDNFTAQRDIVLTGGADSDYYIYSAAGGDVWYQVDNIGGANFETSVPAGNMTLSDDGQSMVLDEIAGAITHAADNTQAHTDYLLNNDDDSTSGTVTMAHLIIGDAGNIGSASDTDAVAIAADGKTTFTQSVITNGDVTIGDANYIGSASDPDAIQIEADGDVALTQDLGVTGTISTPELYNTDGDMKIMPDVQGDVLLFGDTDVGLGVGGGRLKVYRKAAAGDSIFELYLSSTPTAQFSATGAHMNFNLVTANKGARFFSKEHIYMNLGDAVGARKVIIRALGNAQVATVDSLGCGLFLGSYSKVIGGTNIDLYMDNTGLLGPDPSAARFKENIRDIESSERIHQLRPVHYDRKDGTGAGLVGLIADDVATVIPEAVAYKYNPINEYIYDEELETDIPMIVGWEKTDELLTVNMTRLVPFLIAEVQKLRIEIEVIKAEVEILKSR